MIRHCNSNSSFVRHSRIGLVALLLALLTACTSLDFGSSRSIKPVSSSQVVPHTRGAGHLINQLRSANGLSLVASQNVLTRAATTQAGLMAAKGKMDHNTGFRKGFKQRMKDAGVRGASGENIASGYRTIEQTVQSWMNSPPHRAIMLSPRFSKYGIAVRTDPKTNRPYWALVMGT